MGRCNNKNKKIRRFYLVIRWWVEVGKMVICSGETFGGIVICSVLKNRSVFDIINRMLVSITWLGFEKYFCSWVCFFVFCFLL